ncbi:hypothetical protein D3C80_1864600 [compost metagenome]
MDVTSADMLAELDDTLHAAGIKLCVAEMKDPVKDKLKRLVFRTAWRNGVLSNHRRCSQQLSRDSSRGLARSAGRGALSGTGVTQRRSFSALSRLTGSPG